MRVTIDKTFEVEAPIDRVWTLLSDPNRIVGCVPGAKITESVDADNHKGTVSLKVGPVVSDFKGNIVIEKRLDDTHELVLKGDGMDVKGKGSASMTMTGRLQSLDNGGTQVKTSMEVSVMGRLAQLGGRLMEDVSNRMFDQFVACFEEKVGPDTAGDGREQPAESGESSENDVEPIRALPLLFSAVGDAISRFFRRVFGRPNGK